MKNKKNEEEDSGNLSAQQEKQPTTHPDFPEPVHTLSPLLTDNTTPHVSADTIVFLHPAITREITARFDSSLAKSR
jgi:hypothetical protein